MTEIDALDLPQESQQILENLDDALTPLGIPNGIAVLFFCSQADLAAFADSGFKARFDARYAGTTQVALLPDSAGRGLAPELLGRALAGKQGFEFKNQPLLDLLAKTMPGNVAIRFRQRVYVVFARRAAGIAGVRTSYDGSQPASLKEARYQTDHDFAVYCKTYHGDLHRVRTLVESFNKHNRDGVKLFISCPAAEHHLFASLTSANVSVLSDESFAGPYQTEVAMNGMSPGYVNQQICKMTFYLTGLAANYLALDSDCVFIRDFTAQDFMHAPGQPYMVLVMDKDLSIERHYRPVHWIDRQRIIGEIYAHMGVDDRRLRTCHNAQVLNVHVLDSLKHEFMDARGWDYVELLRVAPFEFAWYNVWFQKCRYLPEYSVEPYFKMLHMRPEYVMSRLRLLREEDYAHAYVGLVLNSKWRPATPLRYEDPTAAHYQFYNAIMADETLIERLLVTPVI